MRRGRGAEGAQRGGERTAVRARRARERRSSASSCVLCTPRLLRTISRMRAWSPSQLQRLPTISQISGNSSVAKRTGAVMIPWPRSAPAGLPRSWAEEVKSSLSSMIYRSALAKSQPPHLEGEAKVAAKLVARLLHCRRMAAEDGDGLAALGD